MLHVAWISIDILFAAVAWFRSRICSAHLSTKSCDCRPKQQHSPSFRERRLLSSPSYSHLPFLVFLILVVSLHPFFWSYFLATFLVQAVLPGCFHISTAMPSSTPTSAPLCPCLPLTVSLSLSLSLCLYLVSSPLLFIFFFSSIHALLISFSFCPTVSLSFFMSLCVFCLSLSLSLSLCLFMSVCVSVSLSHSITLTHKYTHIFLWNPVQPKEPLLLLLLNFWLIITLGTMINGAMEEKGVVSSQLEDLVTRFCDRETIHHQTCLCWQGIRLLRRKRWH